MNYKHYLERIGIFNRPFPANAETLFYMQQQHLLHVPFENIDIYNGNPIELRPAAFYEKIVNRKRGGYCYECNGLFCELLRAIGFEVKMISCSVSQRKSFGPAYDHLALIVKLEGREWLVDVGFGDFSRKPLLLEASYSTHNYIVELYGSVNGIQCMSASRWTAAKKRFQPVYLFTTKEQDLADFKPMNHYHQTSAESHFTRSLICSKPTLNGRISLINNRLIIATANGKEERLLYGAHAIENAFEQYFGMKNVVMARSVNV